MSMGHNTPSITFVSRPAPHRDALLATTQPAAIQPDQGGISRAQHRLNGIVAAMLCTILALAPLPLGSNRPSFWALWALLIGLVGVLYGGGLLLTRGRVRISLGSMWPEATLMLAFLAVQAMQLLPLGHLYPLVMTGGQSYTAPRLSFDPGSTLLTLLVTATLLLFFFLMAQVSANRRRARRILQVVFGIVVAYALLGLVSLTYGGDTLLGFDKQYYLGVATGSFVNRNSYATFLAAGLALGVPLLLSTLVGPVTEGGAMRILRPVFTLVGLTLIAAALFATSSRMGTLAGLSGAVLALFATVLLLRRSRFAIVLVLLLCGAAVLALLLLFGTGLVERLVFPQGDESRSVLYGQVWAAILQRPLLGYGAGSFASTFPLFQALPLDGGLVWSYAHSTYLTLWYEQGLIAGSLPLLAIGCVLLRSLLAVGDISSTMLSVATLSVGLVFAMHSLVDFSAEIFANALFFTAVLALGAAGWSVQRRRED